MQQQQQQGGFFSDASQRHEKYHTLQLPRKPRSGHVCHVFTVCDPLGSKKAPSSFFSMIWNNSVPNTKPQLWEEQNDAF